MKKPHDPWCTEAPLVKRCLHWHFEHPSINHVIAPTRSCEHIQNFSIPSLILSIYLISIMARRHAIICALGTINKLDQKKRLKNWSWLCYTRCSFSKRCGTPCFIYNSSMGANEASRLFYDTSKGKIEHHLNELGFDATYHFRPSLLIAPHREEFRLGERLGVWLMSVFAFDPKNYRAIHVSCVAKAMLRHLLSPQRERISSNHRKLSNLRHYNVRWWIIQKQPWRSNQSLIAYSWENGALVTSLSNRFNAQFFWKIHNGLLRLAHFCLFISWLGFHRF